MRVKSDDLELLKEVREYLRMTQQRKLSVPLAALISRLDDQQKKEREANRKRAAKNRENGYRWRSSYHPKTSKYL